jgi:hypothetical protein
MNAENTLEIERNGKMKLLALFLALMMLLGGLASCNPSKNGEDTTSNSGLESEDLNTENATGAPTPIKSDFEGYELNILTGYTYWWTSNDISGDAVGSTVEQAVFRRNETLRTKYNFEILEHNKAEWADVARQNHIVGDMKYQVLSFRINDMPTLGQEGILQNLNEVDGLNLDADYYDQLTRKEGSFANHLFYVTGDMVYRDDMACFMMVFNNRLWDSYELDDVYGKNIYDIISDGEWTLEKMMELSTYATSENGDGIWDENDFYGMEYENADIPAFNIGMGHDFLSRDEDDLFVLNSGDTKMIDDLQTLFSFLNSEDCNYKTHFYGDKILFSTSWVITLTTHLRSSGIDYGLAPYPKADESQNSYRSLIYTYGANCITISSDVEDLDTVANIIELISYESMSTVTPVVSEWLFEGRNIYREENGEMLSLIQENKTYDNSYTWSTGGLYSTMAAVCDAKGEGLASAFAGCAETVKASVARKLERLNQLS